MIPKIGDTVRLLININDGNNEIKKGTLFTVLKTKYNEKNNCTNVVVTTSNFENSFMLYANHNEFEIVTEEREYNGIKEDPTVLANTSDDPVNSPNHYNTGNIETIDYLESLGIAEDFCAGNAIKYLSRYKHKNPDNMLQDIAKASWYVNRLIQIIQNREVK